MAEDTREPETGHAHSHEGEDALVWVEENIEREGFVLALGHHAEHLHVASFVEPAVFITRDKEAVADSQVFNSLVSANGLKVIRQEAVTAHVFEQFINRFRIVLPGAEDELTPENTVEVKQ